MYNKKLFVLALLMIGVGFVFPVATFGSGFGLYEGSARGNAMGGNLAGSADDPSALYYNPAGITQLPGAQFMGGVTLIVPTVDVSTSNPYTGETSNTTSKHNIWPPPHLYATYQFTNNLWLGLGVFSRFGLGTEFPEEWPGRYNNYNAVIKTFSVNPNIAFKLNDNVSLAAGIEIMYFDLTLENKIDLLMRNNPSTTMFDADSSLTGDSTGYGFDLAIHVKATDWLSFGALYRSEVKQHVTGTADFTPPPDVPIPPTLLNDTDAGGTIRLPDEVFLGVAVKPIDRLMLQLGAIWTRWSTYKQLTMTFEEDPFPGTSSVTVPKDWNDVWRFTFGAEYKLFNWLDLRAGYIYDQSPIPDETVDYLVPADDRQMISFGTGIHWKKWTVDLSYTYLMIEDRTVEGRPEDGVYDGEITNGDAHLIGMSLAYYF